MGVITRHYIVLKWKSYPKYETDFFVVQSVKEMLCAKKIQFKKSKIQRIHLEDSV